MKTHALAPYLQRFFTERLGTQLKASPNTIISYRDTFRCAAIATARFAFAVKRRDDRLSFKGPSQPGNRWRNDLSRIAAEAQYQSGLRRCLNIQATHCTNHDVVFSRRPFDCDI